MPENKVRTGWDELPEAVRREVERIACGRVVAADGRPGGFPPGLAARLTLAGGGRAFAKAIDGRWPVEAGFYRREALVAARLAAGLPTPRLRGSFDDGDRIVLVFDDVGGQQPAAPTWSDSCRPSTTRTATCRSRGTPPAGTPRSRLVCPH